MSDYCNYDYAVRASVNLFEDSVEMITKYATDMANERLGEEISEAYKTHYLDAARKDDLAAIAGEEATKKSNETLLASAEKTQKDLRERYEEIKKKLETLEE